MIMFITIYNATTQNNREIDMVHNQELYSATVSIKHKAVDRMKTMLPFWFTLTNKQTRKDDFTKKCIVVAAIFKVFVSGVIPVAVDKINKMAESGSPRLGVKEVVFFAGFLQQ